MNQNQASIMKIKMEAKVFMKIEAKISLILKVLKYMNKAKY